MIRKSWIFLLLAILLFVGCNKLTEGDWDPILLNKKGMTFAVGGGTDSIRTTNYTSWWLAGAWEGTAATAESYIIPESSGSYISYDVVDGNWFEAIVPNRGRSNQLIITTTPNQTGKPRTATIEMTVGDAFRSFQITQEAE